MAIKRKEGNTLVPVKVGYEAALNAKIDAVAEQVSNIDVTVNVGDGLNKDSDGNLILSSHADATTKYGQGSATNFGHVKLTDDYTQAFTANSGIAATPKAIQKAIEEAGGSIGDITPNWDANGGSAIGTKLSDGGLLVTQSGTITLGAKEGGVYMLAACGGGGGGGGGRALDGLGSGGPGGYSSEVVSVSKSIASGTAIQITIGAGGAAAGATTITTGGTTTVYGVNAVGASTKPYRESVGNGVSAAGVAGTNFQCVGGGGASFAQGNIGANGGDGSKFTYGGCSVQAGNGENGNNAGGAFGGYGYGAGGGGGGCGSVPGTYRMSYGGVGAQGAVYILRIS